MKFLVGQVNMDSVTQQSIIYPNRTRKYLLPCLGAYGNELIGKLNSVYKVAVGLGDMLVSKKYYQAPERHLFILLDSSKATLFFIDFLEWIRVQPYYEEDYVYGNLQKTSYHMVILQFPHEFYDSFDTFKRGKYSEMFTEDVVKAYFKSNDNLNAPKVLIKDHNYRLEFTEELNKIFNTTLKPGEYDGELDLPPNNNEETFEL